jgi:hypothetical protein
MDSASFIVSLPPDLRAEVLLTADPDVLASLPPPLVAEAMALRERHMRRGMGPQAELAGLMMVWCFNFLVSCLLQH